MSSAAQTSGKFNTVFGFYKRKNSVIINNLEEKQPSSQREPFPTGLKAAASAWRAGGDLYLQSSKVVPGDANARRLRSSSLSLVTWRSWNRIVSRLSLAGRLSLIAGGGEDASPFTGEPAGVSKLQAFVSASREQSGRRPQPFTHVNNMMYVMFGVYFVPF